ncbi:MAG TPA: WD40 repeat domain-containing protein [Cyclobacteriaceae bacterium]|nr:WD40 repeat domain-containing protein [Cyclobacteriaceae bacterium]
MHKVQVTKVQSYSGHRDCVYTLQPSKDTNHFFSGAGDGMIVKWNYQNPEQGELIAKLPNSVYALHYHSGSNLLIAGHNYDGIHLLEWENKKEIGSLHITEAAIFDIQSLNKKLYVASGDGVVTSIDLEKLVIKQKVKQSEKNARAIAIHATRGELAVGFSDHFIRVFDLETLEMKREWRAHQNSVFTVRYSPEGNFLFSGSRDARLKVWDVQAGYLPVTEIVAHMYAINHLEFSPDGKHFVTCSMDKSIKVWDLGELKLLKVIDKARHAGHGTSVNRLLWTSDLLLSASDDRSVSAWNIELQDS